MQTKYCKESEGVLSAPQTPWWNAFGSSQPLTPESLAGVKVVTPETEQGHMAKHTSETLFTVGLKNSRDMSKPAVQSACFEFGFAQPTHPHVEHYGVVSAYASQMSSGRVMVPLKMETEQDGTVYVNSKQYHGIIRRRQSRAKAVLENKLSRCRKEQPYMHHSRHLHAMRRPRGSSGRFLNTKKTDESNPSNSHVFHPQNGTMKGPNLMGSEVTSMNEFLSSSVHSLGGMVMPSKWIATAINISCCNLKT